MDLYLKKKDELKNDYYVTSQIFNAVPSYIREIAWPTWEYDIIEKINKNENGYFDFSKSFIDIGAESGGYSMFSNFSKNHCFEPNKRNYSLIHTNMYLADKVDNTNVYNVFLNDRIGEVKYDGFNGEESLNFKQSGDVETLKSHLLDEYEIENVGLIKVDVEGYEYNVFRGGINTIINNNYPPILFENWEIGKHGWNKEKHDRVNGFLEELGYKIFTNWGNKDTHLAINDKFYKDRYIVSMTTIPSRKKRLKDSIKSILGQSWQGFHKYCINIDDNLSEEDYNFYYDLKNLDKRIEINVCDAKWRSCNKLLPTIKKYPENPVITVDDDVLYPKDVLRNIVNEYEKNPDCIVSSTCDITLIDNGVYNGHAQFDDICLKQKNYSKYLSNCCLFPPHVLDNTDVYDYDKMMYCTNGTHDELWFWINTTLKGVKAISKNNYLENISTYIMNDTYEDGYQLSNINKGVTLEEYTKKINQLYGDRLGKILSEKTEFVLDSENIYNLFYNFFILKLFYGGNYILNVKNLPAGKIKTLKDFLCGSGINPDDVIVY